MSKQWRFCVKLVREILSLKFRENKSNREIARLKSSTKDTVRAYVTRAEGAGIICLETLNATSDDALYDIIFPHPIKAPKKVPLDFDWIHKELARPNVTLALLWKELSSQNEGFYKYSWFCDLYRQWEKSREISMRVPHKAGEKLFVDYAGTTVPVVINRKTGETQDAQVFVACLGVSQLTYVEATWSQNSRDFIHSHIQAFEFFGGAPQMLVPDNLKSAVNIASKYEPEINQSYRAMAKYYGCTVVPARAYRPKDKAKVENAVLIASRWILARLRDQKFFSLEELNHAIWQLLEEFNQAKFQKLNYSRRSFFEEVEKA